MNERRSKLACDIPPSYHHLCYHSSMTTTPKTPFYRESDHEFVGYIVQEDAGWQAQTVFGYTIERTTDRAAAEEVLRSQGLSFLLGVWQYFDKDDQAWHPCVLKEVQDNRVIVLRTSSMGYQDPDESKIVVIEHPTENELIKS